MQEKDMALSNVYTPNTVSHKHMKQTLRDTKRELMVIP